MTEVAGYKREDLSIDQHLALRTAAVRQLLDELDVPAVSGQ
jgi:hypothetical protein